MIYNLPEDRKAHPLLKTREAIREFEVSAAYHIAHNDRKAPRGAADRQNKLRGESFFSELQHGFRGKIHSDYEKRTDDALDILRATGRRLEV